MAIIDSVKKLASKVGADTNGRTIAEQINNINRHLDSTGSRDIAEAVSKFADKEDGSFTFNKIHTYGVEGGAADVINVQSDEVTVNAQDDNGSSFTRPIKKLTISGSAPSHKWVFVPTSDFDGIYKGENKLTFTGDTVLPGQGVYQATINEMMGTNTMKLLYSGTRVPFEII